MKKESKNNVVYEYGAMSTKYRLVANDKLTAYATMVMHYNRSNHLVAIYVPESSKQDQWTSFTGQVSDRLDEIFGGDGSFDKYFDDNSSEIQNCYDSIEKIVG